MKNRFWLILGLTVVTAVALLAIGCEVSSSTVPSDHLTLTMSFDNDPDGYYEGEQASVDFMEGYRFRLYDAYGTFEGNYKWLPDKNKLTLDFDDYPAWYMTLDPDGTFSGSEADYSNGGTYEWQ